MKNSIYSRGPYFNGIRPKRFLANLTDYYNRKSLTSDGGKQYNESLVIDKQTGAIYSAKICTARQLTAGRKFARMSIEAIM